MISAFTRLAADERGNSFIEMALVTPLFAALLIGTVDLSRAYSARIDLEQAAQRTIEKIQIADYKEADNTTIQTEAQAAAGTGSAATVTDWLQCGTTSTHKPYTDSCNTGEATARFIRVSISKSYTPMFTAAIFRTKSNGVVPLTGVAGVRVQ